MINIQSVIERLQYRTERVGANPSREEKSDAYECRVCHDNFVVAVLDTGEQVPVGDKSMWDPQSQSFKPHRVYPCSCVLKNRISKLFRSSHITKNFQNVEFTSFVVEGRPECIREARETAVDYVDRFDQIRVERANSIAMVGPPGSGKTHLLMAVSNRLMRKGIQVQYFPWVEGFNDLKDNLEELKERVNAMKQVEVLFVDDLYKGRRVPTDFMLEQLFGVVNYRYLNGLPVIISSEKNFDELFAIDEGIGRRIYEMARGHRIQMGLSRTEVVAGMELNYSLTCLI